MNRLIKIQLGLLAALLLSASHACAWNNVGHRVIAELAWRQMNETQRHAVSALLREHPHYQQMLAADVPKGVFTDEWVFLNAANWPDWIRRAKEGQPPKPLSITKYDLYPHAIGYPFLWGGETNRALLEKFFIARPDAEMVLSNSILNLKNNQAAAADRAVSLCWTIHLMGDLHQPLHGANPVTTAHPDGDRLGGHHLARDTHGKQINMHAFWDELLGVDPSYRTAAKLADHIAADRKLKPSAMKEYNDDKTIASWVQESFRIAVDFAYSTNHVHLVQRDDVTSGKIAPSALPKLTADYTREAEKIARRRIALAAARLTDELKGAF